MRFTVDAEAGPAFYTGVIRMNGSGSVSHCDHVHRSRKAAERCPLMRVVARQLNGLEPAGEMPQVKP